MNELQFYTASIPDSNPNKAELIRQWKIENKWGQQEVKEVVEAPVKEVKTNGAAETDAAVVPTPEASESSDSGSGNLKSSLFEKSDFQNSYEKQDKLNKEYEKNKADYEAQMLKLNKVSKIDEIYSPGDGYNYRFSIDPESNTLKYEAKTVESEEFKEKSGIAAFSIANMLGHLNEEEKETLAEINAQNKAESEKQKKREQELLQAKKNQLTAIPLVQEGVVKDVDPGISFSKKANYLLKQLSLNSEVSTLKLEGRDTRAYKGKVEEYINSGMTKKEAETKATSESSVVDASYDVIRDSTNDIIKGLKGYTDQEKEDFRSVIDLTKKLSKIQDKVQINARMIAANPFGTVPTTDETLKEGDYKNLSDQLDVLNKKYSKTPEQVATPEALKDFTEQFNTLQGNYGRGSAKTNEVIFNQTINGIVKNDPFIKAELLKLQIIADQEIKDFSAELQKKYDTSTVEGNKKATEELQQFAKSLTQDKLLQGDVFKERFSQIQTVGLQALQGINIEDAERNLLAARMQDPIFAALESARKTPLLPASLLIEGLMKGGKRFQNAINVVQKDLAADGARDSINMLSSLEKALESGEVDLTTKLSFNKGGFMTVEKALDYFKKAKNYDEKNIVEQLDDLSDISKDLGLYREIDPEDSWLTRTFQTVAESAPMMGAALAGTAVTYLTGGTASAIIAPVASTLGTAALFTQFYGDAWEDTFMEGARSEAKSKGIDLDNISKEERRDFLLQALQSGKYDKSANATATAAFQTATEKFGFSKQMSAASKALGLGKEGITSLIQGQWKQTGKAFFRGSLAKLESAASEGVTEWSQTIIGDLNRGFAYGKGTDFVNFNSAWKAAKAGSSAGLLMPGGAAIISQTRVEIQNLSRKIAIQFVPDSDFGQASLVADNYFKAAQTELNQRLKLGVNPDGTEYTIQQHQEDTNALASTSNAYRRIPSTASTEVRTELLDLMVKRDKLQLEINKVNDSDLTALQQLELNLVKNEIKELAKEASAPVGVRTDARALREGASVAIGQLGAGVERVSNTKDLLSSILSLEAQGIKVNINRNEKGEILPAKEQDYGIFAKVPDGKGGFDIQLIINDVSAKADGLLPADKHELLHIAAMKMDDASKIKMGSDILNSLINDSNIQVDRKTRRLLAAYKADLDKGIITAADFFEEVMAVTSDGLTPDSKTGVSAIRVKDISKFKAIAQKILQTIGWRQNFADGQQAIDFLKEFNADVLKGEGLSESVLSRFDTKTDTGIETKIESSNSKPSKKDTGAIASTKVQEIYDTQGEAGAFDIIEQFKPIVSRIVEKRSEAPNFDRQLLTDEIETGKRGIFDLIKEYKPESGVPLAAYINKFLPARAIEASQRVLGEEFTVDVTEAKGVMAEEVEAEVATRTTKRKIKPSSLISNDAIGKIKEQVQEKIKGIDPKNLTFKKLGDLAPEIIAAEIGIPVKKLTVATANLSKGDATAIQQFVNKNADKLLKILPEGAVVEAATEKLLGTSTGVPKGLLNAFYTKQARLGKGAGLAPFKLNKGISKADFLEAFGIVEGKKAEGFDARSPQAQALKGIASLYGKLVTNEIVRSDTDLSLEAKQDVAAGKNKAMASKRDAGSQYNVDSNVVNAGYKPIKPGVEGVTDLSNFLVDDLTKVFGKNASLFAVASNLAGAGNSYIGSKPTSGAKGRKFLFISDANKTKRYIKETKEALESGELGDLKVINNTISALEGLDAISESDLKAIKQAISSQTIKNIEGNLKNKSLHDKGVRLIIEKLAKLYKLDPKNIRGIASIIYNQNANYSFGRKMAAVLGLEQGIEPGSKSWEEHVYQFGNFANRTLEAISSDNPKVLDGWIKWVNDNYYQEVTGKETQAIVDATYFKDGITWKAKSEEHPYLNEKLNEAFKTGDFSEVPPADIRKYNEYFALNPNNRSIDGVSDAAKYNVEVDAKFRNNLDVQAEQQKLIYEQFIGETTAEKAKQDIKVYTELATGKSMASKRDSDLIPDAIKYDRPITVQTAINALEKTDKALANGRKLDQPVKKIRVFDFDDTLARTKSNVLYTMPDGTTGKIDAATFAKEAGNMEAEGAQWDFSEFSKVMQGSKGPLLDVAKIIADKRGTKDVFVLTARPANAAGPIKEFLASVGLDIPLANITGLGDGAPAAKAGWIMGKAAEGYNDFYFADDHTGNVKAVKDVLSQIDVKSKVQLAKASKRQTFDTIVNDMIEDSSGIETYKNYSAARAKTVGANKGRFNFFIPPSAEDFTGLLYKMLGKGKKGDAQMAFLKANLLDPYDRAESAVTQAKISAANDFKALKTELKTLPTSLSVPTGIGGFTYSHAVRTAIWTAQGMDIPGLSKKDIKELNDFVQNDPELRVFANELIKIQKGKPYPKPGKDWLGGNITSDIINDINKVNRAEYQQEWRENVDIIFSEDNMNKMEAAYGTRWREAIEDSLRRMKSGSNRPPGGNRATDGILDWLNNSVGAVMFLNTRSALLQTISAVNFINWGDNNIVKAGAAFANQKQFWSDFMTLMNSDYLVERRNGLKINVSESEIADAVRDSGNKVKSAIAFLLSKGFVMTRFADSFAIATGGSTFYRNRVKALVAKGMEQKAAEAQAFDDFRQIAEESQQSSNPNRISAQQASAAGRVILAWANTPMQYARIQKRAGQDLINGRGDWKTNVSKIVYYGAIQNLIFNSLQQAVFALGFGEDDEEKDAKKNEKISRVVNGMIDSQLKGLGIGGAAVLALKSTLMELGKQHAKKRPEYDEAVFDLLNFSPPLGSKVNKIRGGLRSFSWNKKEMKEKGFSLDNPSYLAGAQVVTGLTNVPLDRVAKKINNVRGIVNEESALWQKVALGLGWSTWELGLGYYGGFDAAKVLTPEEEKVKEIDDMKKLTKTKEQVDMLLDLGLSKKEIKALGKQQNRVEKIIELQNAKAEPKKEAEVKKEIKEETKPTKPEPTPKPKVKTVSAEARLRRQFDSIKDENKPDQVKTLLKFGLSKKEIRALKYEKNRVEKILELMPKNK